MPRIKGKKKGEEGGTFVVDQHAIYDALGKLKRATSREQPNVLMRAVDNTLSITATDGQIQVECLLKGEGRLLPVPLPATTLMKVLKCGKRDKFEARIRHRSGDGDADRVDVTTGKSTSSLRCDSPESFPQLMPTPSSVKTVLRCSGNDERDILHGGFLHVFPVALVGENYKNLDVVCFVGREMYTTDGHRAHRAVGMPFDVKKQLLVPQQAVKFMMELLKSEDVVRVSRGANDSCLVVKMGNWKIVSREPTESYPLDSMRDMMNEVCECKLSLDVEEFRAALARLTVVVPKNGCMKIAIKKSDVVLSGKNDLGEIEASVRLKRAKSKIADDTLHLSVHYILEAIKRFQLDGQRLTMHYNDNLSPVHFADAHSDPQNIDSIVMPMRG